MSGHWRRRIAPDLDSPDLRIYPSGTSHVPSDPSVVRINLRVPEIMRQRIQERAAANGRGMNTELVTMLQQSFDGIGEYAAIQEEAEMLRGHLRLINELAQQPQQRLHMLENEMVRMQMPRTRPVTST